MAPAARPTPWRAADWHPADASVSAPGGWEVGPAEGAATAGARADAGYTLDHVGDVTCLGVGAWTDGPAGGAGADGGALPRPVAVVGRGGALAVLDASTGALLAATEAFPGKGTRPAACAWASWRGGAALAAVGDASVRLFAVGRSAGFLPQLPLHLRPVASITRPRGSVRILAVRLDGAPGDSGGAEPAAAAKAAAAAGSLLLPSCLTLATLGSDGRLLVAAIACDAKGHEGGEWTARVVSESAWQAPEGSSLLCACLDGGWGEVSREGASSPASSALPSPATQSKVDPISASSAPSPRATRGGGAPPSASPAPPPLTALGTAMGDVIVWDPAAGTHARSRLHRGPVWVVRWLPGESAFASGGDDRVVRVWRVEREAREAEGAGGCGEPRDESGAAPLRRDRSPVRSAGRSSKTRLRLAPLWVGSRHQGRVRDLTWSRRWEDVVAPGPDRRRAVVASTGEDGRVVVWDGLGGRGVLASVPAHERGRATWKCSILDVAEVRRERDAQASACFDRFSSTQAGTCSGHSHSAPVGAGSCRSDDDAPADARPCPPRNAYVPLPSSRDLASHLRVLSGGADGAVYSWRLGDWLEEEGGRRGEGRSVALDLSRALLGRDAERCGGALERVRALALGGPRSLLLTTTAGRLLEVSPSSTRSTKAESEGPQRTWKGEVYATQVLCRVGPFPASGSEPHVSVPPGPKRADAMIASLAVGEPSAPGGPGLEEPARQSVAAAPDGGARPYALALCDDRGTVWACARVERPPGGAESGGSEDARPSFSDPWLPRTTPPLDMVAYGWRSTFVACAPFGAWSEDADGAGAAGADATRANAGSPSTSSSALRGFAGRPTDTATASRRAPVACGVTWGSRRPFGSSRLLVAWDACGGAALLSLGSSLRVLARAQTPAHRRITAADAVWVERGRGEGDAVPAGKGRQGGSGRDEVGQHSGLPPDVSLVVMAVGNGGGSVSVWLSLAGDNGRTSGEAQPGAGAGEIGAGGEVQPDAGAGEIGAGGEAQPGAGAGENGDGARLGLATRTDGAPMDHSASPNIEDKGCSPIGDADVADLEADAFAPTPSRCVLLSSGSVHGRDAVRFLRIERATCEVWPAGGRGACAPEARLQSGGPTETAGSASELAVLRLSVLADVLTSGGDGRVVRSRVRREVDVVWSKDRAHDAASCSSGRNVSSSTTRQPGQTSGFAPSPCGLWLASPSPRLWTAWEDSPEPYAPMPLVDARLVGGSFLGPALGFRGDDAVVTLPGLGAEVARVRCGGWRHPCAGWVERGADARAGFFPPGWCYAVVSAGGVVRVAGGGEGDWGAAGAGSGRKGFGGAGAPNGAQGLGNAATPAAKSKRAGKDDVLDGDREFGAVPAAPLRLPSAPLPGVPTPPAGRSSPLCLLPPSASRETHAVALLTWDDLVGDPGTSERRAGASSRSLRPALCLSAGEDGALWARPVPQEGDECLLFAQGGPLPARASLPFSWDYLLVPSRALARPGRGAAVRALSTVRSRGLGTCVACGDGQGGVHVWALRVDADAPSLSAAASITSLPPPSAAAEPTFPPSPSTPGEPAPAAPASPAASLPLAAIAPQIALLSALRLESLGALDPAQQPRAPSAGRAASTAPCRVMCLSAWAHGDGAVRVFAGRGDGTATIAELSAASPAHDPLPSLPPSAHPSSARLSVPARSAPAPSWRRLGAPTAPTVGILLCCAVGDGASALPPEESREAAQRVGGSLVCAPAGPAHLSETEARRCAPSGGSRPATSAAAAVRPAAPRAPPAKFVPIVAGCSRGGVWVWNGAACGPLEGARGRSRAPDGPPDAYADLRWAPEAGLASAHAGGVDSIAIVAAREDPNASFASEILAPGREGAERCAAADGVPRTRWPSSSRTVDASGGGGPAAGRTRGGAEGDLGGLRAWTVASGGEGGDVALHRLELRAPARREPSGEKFSLALAPLARVAGAHSSAVRGLALSPDLRELLSTGTDQRLRIWEVEWEVRAPHALAAGAAPAPRAPERGAAATPRVAHVSGRLRASLAVAAAPVDEETASARVDPGPEGDGASTVGVAPALVPTLSSVSARRPRLRERGAGTVLWTPEPAALAARGGIAVVGGFGVQIIATPRER